MSTIPKQHGAWTVLVASLFIGIVAGMKFGGRFGAETILAFVAIVSGFFLRHIFTTFLRSGRSLKWLALYSLISISSVLILIFHYDRAHFAYFALAAAAVMLFTSIMERMRLDRTLAGEIAGVWGLALAAPAMFYAATGKILAAEIFILWTVPAIFFGLNVVFVRYALRHSEFSTRQIGYAALACTVIFTAIVAMVFTV